MNMHAVKSIDIYSYISMTYYFDFIVIQYLSWKVAIQGTIGSKFSVRATFRCVRRCTTRS